jgi:hypothetical protein
MATAVEILKRGWEDSWEQHRLEGERARRVRKRLQDKGGTTMSDDQRPHEHEDDEVEAHNKHRLGENAEAGDETESEDDEVEAHNKHRLA